MRGEMLLLVLMLAASEATAQNYEGEERREAVPPLPGSGSEEAPPSAEQTPPTQENVIPQPVPDEGTGEALDGQSRQPTFDRDATPQSTQEERQGEDGVQEYQGPATGEAAPEETPETRVPGAPDDEVDPHGPIMPPDPDEIPDRRFETFETQADPAGTPELNVPKQPTTVEGTPPL